MDVIKVVGGRSVTGEVTVEGAKNSALKLMAATIMAPGVTTLTNVPNIADVHVMGKVLKTLGARIEVVGLHELGDSLQSCRTDACINCCFGSPYFSFWQGCCGNARWL